MAHEIKFKFDSINGNQQNHKSMKKRAELIFVPAPGMGHLFVAVEMAKLMISHDDRLSITVLTMRFPSDAMAGAESLPPAASASTRLHFVSLPEDDDEDSTESVNNPPANFIYTFVEKQKPKVKDAVAALLLGAVNPPDLAGFVIDMFCSTMIDVADEFSVPTYVFYTSNAGILGMLFHMQKLRDELGIDVTEFKDSESEFQTPSYASPVPAKVLPSVLTDKDGSTALLNIVRRYRETKGILVNTFEELESHALKSLSTTFSPPLPPIYPVGPVVNLDGRDQPVPELMTWLDEQPPSSVVFLCFGSLGSFGSEQVQEIASGLELSGTRFLWSLRQPPPKGKFELPKDYPNPSDVLPDGFLDRTSGTGKVIGWAPQVAVLAHPAVGGFVSHCGWNSVLESLWYGVPLATWPLYAEQQMNAFALVKEFGLAVEIKLDYRRSFRAESSIIVSAEEIAAGIVGVMAQDSEVRRRVQDTKEKCRKALMDGGSSRIALGRMIQDVLGDKVAAP